MYTESVQALSDQAVTKIKEQRRSLAAHLVRSMLAGMYVAAAIVLIFSIGGSISEVAKPFVPMVMGICFGGALTIVIFAGSELFTGSNLVMTLGVLTRKTRVADLLTNWGWTWLGNLAGSALIAVLVVRSGVFDAEPIKTFVLKLVEKKMNYGVEALLYRSILANWLVCLGVWMAARIKNEAARVLMIWWCMFTFITCGYEHSIANMCGLLLGLLLPHEGFNITWTGTPTTLACRRWATSSAGRCSWEWRTGSAAPSCGGRRNRRRRSRSMARCGPRPRPWPRWNEFTARGKFPTLSTGVAPS